MPRLSKRKAASRAVGQLGGRPRGQVNSELADINTAIGYQDAILTGDDNRVTPVKELSRQTLWRNRKRKAGAADGEDTEINDNVIGIILCTFEIIITGERQIMLT